MKLIHSPFMYFLSVFRMTVEVSKARAVLASNTIMKMLRSKEASIVAGKHPEPKVYPCRTDGHYGRSQRLFVQ